MLFSIGDDGFACISDLLIVKTNMLLSPCQNFEIVFTLCSEGGDTDISHELHWLWLLFFGEYWEMFFPDEFGFFDLP